MRVAHVHAGDVLPGEQGAEPVGAFAQVGRISGAPRGTNMLSNVVENCNESGSITGVAEKFRTERVSINMGFSPPKSRNVRRRSSV